MRKFLLFLSIILVGVIFISRLFYLQVYQSQNHDLFEDNAIRKVYDYPKRGFVYDRNGELLVANQPSYDVMFIPREVKPLDTLEFCSLLNINKEQFLQIYNKAYHYSPWLPSVFIPHLSKEDYAVLQEKMRKFEGFYIQKRSLRLYQTSIGANVLGDIGEVNNAIIEKQPYYKMGDLIGKQGVEASYEDILRGVKGIKFIQKDRFNRDLGPYKNGIYDTLPQPGKDITVTIDAKLQEDNTVNNSIIIVHYRRDITQAPIMLASVTSSPIPTVLRVVLAVLVATIQLTAADVASKRYLGLNVPDKVLNQPVSNKLNIKVTGAGSRKGPVINIAVTRQCALHPYIFEQPIADTAALGRLYI